ncbi:hypothetical protein CR513_21779, partial [Mucuna pruriens]
MVKDPTLSQALVGKTHSFLMPKQKDNDIKGEWRSGEWELSRKIYKSESESSSVEAPNEGNLPMVRRLMSTLIGDDQSQRENIFH